MSDDLPTSQPTPQPQPKPSAQKSFIPEQPLRSHSSTPDFMPHFTPLQKQMLKGLLALAVLGIGVVVATTLFKRGTENRSRAGAGGINISLNGPATAALNDQITVDVLVTDTGGDKLAAADLLFDYEKTLLRLDNVVMGNGFDSTSIYPAAGTTIAGNELLKDVAQDRYAVGAACDQCYLGEAPNPLPTLPPPATPGTTIPSCGDTTPMCYPKTVASDGAGARLATATFTVIGTGSSTTNISLIEPNPYNDPTAPGTRLAALDRNDTAIPMDTELLGTVTPLTVTLGGGTPTITACDADINQNTIVDAGDYSLLSSNYLQVPANSRIDINKNGIVDAGDYTNIVTYYLQSCN